MAYRKKPEISQNNHRVSSHHDNDLLGCILIPVVSAIGYFIILATLHLIDGTATKVEKSISLTALICLTGMFIYGMSSLYLDRKAKETQTKEWARNSTVAQVKIVECGGGVWDDGNRFHSSWWVKLAMNGDQIAVSPNETIVSAQISQSVYERLKNSSTVRIYYQPDTPLTFLLEEELPLI